MNCSILTNFRDRLSLNIFDLASLAYSSVYPVISALDAESRKVCQLQKTKDDMLEPIFCYKKSSIDEAKQAGEELRKLLLE